MRHRTEQWSKMAARGRFRMEAKARIGSRDYTSISAPKINRSLMSSPLSVGNCISATMSLSMLTNDPIIAQRPITILGRLESDGIHSEWKEFGTFYINQRDTSYEGLITVDCYDAMLKANQLYLDDDDTSEWPKSMLDVVSEIATRIGVGIDPRTRICTGDDYVVSEPADKTMIQVLGYIGACHGGNWIITEENLLRLVPLVNAPAETFRIISENYENIKASNGALLAYRVAEEQAELPGLTGEKPNSAITATYHITDESGQPIVTADGHYLVWAKDGSADAVDGLINVPVVCGNLVTGTAVTVTGVTASNESGDTFTIGDKSGFMLTIESNPYMTKGICEALYTAFYGLVYEPYTATKACYDPAAELGDQVKIGDKVRSVLCDANIRFDMDFRSDISAPNSEELSAEYPFLSRYKQLLKTADSMTASIQKTADELAETLEEANLDLSGLQEALQAEIKRAGEVETALSGKIDSLQTKVDGLDEKLTALTNTVNEHTTLLAELKSQVEALSSSNT